jgi:hypothetical protein
MRVSKAEEAPNDEKPTDQPRTTNYRDIMLDVPAGMLLRAGKHRHHRDAGGVQGRPMRVANDAGRLLQDDMRQ